MVRSAGAWPSTIAWMICGETQASDTAALQALCASLLGGDRFRASTMAEIALGNPNPLAHVPNALGNLTRIERKETWSNYEMMTPAVCALIEKLDEERLALVARVGVEVRGLVDHIHMSFGTPKASLAEMCRHIFNTRGGPAGPVGLETRYITEDVPYEWVPMLALARAAGVDLPGHEALTTTLSLVCRRDFRAENRLLDGHGTEQMGLAELCGFLGLA